MGLYFLLSAHLFSYLPFMERGSSSEYCVSSPSRIALLWDSSMVLQEHQLCLEVYQSWWTASRIQASLDGRSNMDMYSSSGECSAWAFMANLISNWLFYWSRDIDVSLRTIRPSPIYFQIIWSTTSLTLRASNYPLSSEMVSTDSQLCKAYLWFSLCI